MKEESGQALWHHRFHGDIMASICQQVIQCANDCRPVALMVLENLKMVLFVSSKHVYQHKRTGEQHWQEPF